MSGEAILSVVELERLADAVADRVAARLADADRLIDVHELAELLGCSVPTIERMTRAGAIPSVTIGRLRRYDRRAVLAALAEKHKGGRGYD